MRRTLLLSVAFVIPLALTVPAAHAQEASCVDTTGMMCLDLVAATGSVTDDVFLSTDGLYAPQLHFATYIRGVNGCIGNTYDATMLSAYTCHTVTAGEDVGFYANSLDWYWSQVIRTDDSGAGLPDGTPGFYYPWRGRIMDLGGEANRVVLFPVTDHPPLPCEAFEYSVYLTNNPDATTIAPVTAPDPMQWNPAKLTRAFTQGWTRNPTATGVPDATTHAADLGTFLRDNSAGEAVADALATVWSLPCGITFRYVAIQAGNYGNPGPVCEFESSDDELDAVAGLNEDGSSICIDADGDGHRALTCGGDDCDDTDPSVHPGAFEPCDATRDLDCRPASPCPTGTVCSGATGLCSTACFEGACDTGFLCNTDGTCVESACSGVVCTGGMICRGGACVGACDGVVCPHGELCISGACIDPCLGVVCPSNQVCIAGAPGATQLCGPSCACTEAMISCASGSACDTRPGTSGYGMCVDTGCEALTCGADMVCVGGTCVDSCAGVVCPGSEVCRHGDCQSDPCAGVRCGAGMVCSAGACVDACAGVTCAAGEMCTGGTCVADPCASTSCAGGSHCVAGACVDDDAGGGTGMDGGIAADAGGHTTASGGCCRVDGASGTGAQGIALVVGVTLLFARRRRR